MRRQVSAVLFWGGLWGISEATVSYLVHLFLPGMGWVFYYPLAYGFIAGACRQTGHPLTALLCAFLSAAIKLINLPISPRLDYVINPAVSILLEGLAVWLAFRFIKSREKPAVRDGLLPLVTSAAWRGLYLAYLLLAPSFIKEASVLYNPGGLLRFATLELLGNAFVISLGALLLRLLAKSTVRLGPRVQSASRRGFSKYAYGTLSLAVTALAVALQWVF